MNPLCPLSSLFGGSPLLAGAETAASSRPLLASVVLLALGPASTCSLPEAFGDLYRHARAHTHTSMHVHLCAHAPLDKEGHLVTV